MTIKLSLFFLILSSCMNTGQPKDESINMNETNQMEKSDSIVLIRLSDDISFNWDNRSQDIIKDTLLGLLLTTFSEKQESIIDQILSTSETPAKTCSIERNLVIGDLAFLLIDKIKKIPYFQVLGVQWDSFDSKCKYPEGMFDYIKNYRGEVKQKVESYLTSKK